MKRNFQVFDIPPLPQTTTSVRAAQPAVTNSRNFSVASLPADSDESSEVTVASLGETTVSTPSTDGPSIFERSGDPAAIQKELRNLRAYLAAHPNESQPYAYINKPDTNGALNTYLVEIKTGRVINNFPSLQGYNGIGCGFSQTRPGIYKLEGQQIKGASKLPWWGNNWAAYHIRDVAGGAQCGKPLSNEILAHSNVKVPDTRTGAVITSRSAGCFTTSPNNLKEVMLYAGKALIYNAVGTSDTNPSKNNRARTASLWW